jgi:hypothetical protein
VDNRGATRGHQQPSHGAKVEAELFAAVTSLRIFVLAGDGQHRFHFWVSDKPNDMIGHVFGQGDVEALFAPEVMKD